MKAAAKIIAAAGATILLYLLWRSLEWGLLSVAGLLGALRKPSGPYGMRRWLAIAGVVYGLAHYTLQFKAYDYHMYPLEMFVCLFAAGALAPELRATRISSARTGLWTGGRGGSQGTSS